MEKDFKNWHLVKSNLNNATKSPIFKQREIWWCSIGINIGHESDGKSQYFTRPVLIIRKFNNRIFLGAPLTTKIKDNPFYYRIHLHEHEQCVMLSQLRMWDSRRLRNRLGWLSKDQFNNVRKILKSLI